MGVALDGRLPQGASDRPILTYRTFAPVDLAAVQALRVSRVPTVVLVDSEFVVTEIWTGELDLPRVQEIVRIAGRLTVAR